MCSGGKLGEIVISTAGRDSGKYYIIIGVENKNYVLLADGDKRRVEHPKRKNIHHLHFTGNVVEELSIWLADDKRVRNEDFRKILNEYEINEEAK